MTMAANTSLPESMSKAFTENNEVNVDEVKLFSQKTYEWKCPECGVVYDDTPRRVNGRITASCVECNKGLLKEARERKKALKKEKAEKVVVNDDKNTKKEMVDVNVPEAKSSDEDVPEIREERFANENQFFELLKRMTKLDIVFNDRRILQDNGREIDAVIPDLRVGFEFNDRKLHTNSSLSRQYKVPAAEYHIRKRRAAKKRGIDLYFVWASDLNSHYDEIIADIKTVLSGRTPPYYSYLFDVDKSKGEEL